MNKTEPLKSSSLRVLRLRTAYCVLKISSFVAAAALNISRLLATTGPHGPDLEGGGTNTCSMTGVRLVDNIRGGEGEMFLTLPAYQRRLVLCHFRQKHCVDSVVVGLLVSLASSGRKVGRSLAKVGGQNIWQRN